MTIEDLYQEIKSLPPSYQEEVEHFIGYLKTKFLQFPVSEITDKRILGIGKGKGWIAADFDKPMDDLKEYM